MAARYRPLQTIPGLMPHKHPVGKHEDEDAATVLARTTLSCAFTADGKQCVTGGGDRIVRAYFIHPPAPTAAAKEADAGGPLKKSSIELSAQAAAGECAALTSTITALAFRPDHQSSTGAKNVLVAACSDGNISHWHLGSGRVQNSVKETDNEVFCLGFPPHDATKFATAGRDGAVRVYDEDRRTVFETLVRGVASTESDDVVRPQAHTNRVQALKWLDGNTLLTGGWDRTIQLFDLRAGRSVRSTSGPYLCGPGVDVHGHLMVTGSTRPKEGLQFWDQRFMPSSDGSGGGHDPLCTVAWPPMARHAADADDSDAPPPPTTDLFAVAFSPDGHYVAAGGNTDFRVFQVLNGAIEGNAGKPEPIALPPAGEAQRGGGSTAVFDVKFTPCGRRVLAGGNGGTVFGTDE